MRRFAQGLAAAAAVMGSVPASADDVTVAKVPAKHRRAWCRQTFTVAMGERAARRVYAGTRDVPRRGLRVLGYIEMCARTPRDRALIRRYDHRQARLHAARVVASRVTWAGPVVASWFDDGGGTACGIHATYGFATLLGIPCGATITMRGPSGTAVIATREDSGPYVAGRTFDLNPALKAALGCPDLCEVYWH